MNTAGTALKSYVVAYNNEGLSVEERMSCLDIFKLAALNLGNNLIFLNACGLKCALIELLSHNIELVAGFYDYIVELRANANSYVAGESPCCGSPNYKEGL